MHDIMELVWIVPRYVLKTHPGGRTQQASVVGLDTENFDEVQEKIADAERVVSIKNLISNERQPGSSGELV